MRRKWAATIKTLAPLIRTLGRHVTSVIDAGDARSLFVFLVTLALWGVVGIWAALIAGSMVSIFRTAAGLN